MKKIALLLVFLVSIPLISAGEANTLRLRASNHPEFLRIVLEGDLSMIEAARVYQRSENVLVKFPDKEFTIEKEKIKVPFEKADKGIMFYPGKFRGLNVFRLKSPDRLVIDVYMTDRQRKPSRGLQPGIEEKDPSVLFSDLPFYKKQEETPEPNSVVIDPGHGGYDNGLTDGRYREKNIVLDISRKLNALLNEGSFRGSLTRGSDRFMSQLERAEFANERESGMFLSVHIGSRKEVVIYLPVITDDVSDAAAPYLKNKGQGEHMNKTITLMKAMEEAVTTEFGEGMVTVRPLPYSLLSKIETAALMIELPSFDSTVYDEELRARMAKVLYKGFYIYEEIKPKKD